MARKRVKAGTEGQTASLARWVASASLTVASIEKESRVGVLVNEANKVEAAAQAVRGMIELGQQAQDAHRELVMLSLYARWTAGLRLKALSPGGRGKPKSERMRAGGLAGLSDDQVRRLVKFAGIPRERVTAIAEAILAESRVPTAYTVTRAAQIEEGAAAPPRTRAQAQRDRASTTPNPVDRPQPSPRTIVPPLSTVAIPADMRACVQRMAHDAGVTPDAWVLSTLRAAIFVEEVRRQMTHELGLAS